MQFSVTFRQMDATESLKGYARDRMERVKKYLPDPIAIDVVMSTERHLHRIDVNVQLHNGLVIAGHEETENMYSSIDLVIAKIERQVRRYKDKLRAHKSRAGGVPPLPWQHSIVSEENHDEPAAFVEETSPARDAVVLRTERLHATPLSVSEAVMQLNLVQQQFLVFRNSESGAVNVVYRRGDGKSYGLIDASEASA